VHPAGNAQIGSGAYMVRKCGPNKQDKATMETSTVFYQSFSPMLPVVLLFTSFHQAHALAQNNRQPRYQISPLIPALFPASCDWWLVESNWKMNSMCETITRDYCFLNSELNLIFFSFHFQFHFPKLTKYWGWFSWPDCRFSLENG
jgi:hypothetical protein